MLARTAGVGGDAIAPSEEASVGKTVSWKVSRGNLARFPFALSFTPSFTPPVYPSSAANDLKTAKIYGGLAYQRGRMPARSPGR